MAWLASLKSGIPWITRPLLDLFLHAPGGFNPIASGAGRKSPIQIRHGLQGGLPAGARNQAGDALIVALDLDLLTLDDQTSEHLPQIARQLCSRNGSHDDSPKNLL